MWPVPVWIRTADDAEALARDLRGVSAVAIDTEADSLHHYPERLCLIQLADPAGRVFFLDALVLVDLEPLRPLFGDPATLKVFHSGDNDVVYLKRRFGLAFAGLSDTMLAARFLGVRELGLERLLLKYMDVPAARSQQKTDWARRPLTPPQEHYAAEDVRHLIPLRERLVADLRAIQRVSWLEEECEALAALPVPERPSDEDSYRRIRGASRLPPRGLAVLRVLYLQREAWARAEHRPPFKVLSPETLVALAERAPAEPAALQGVPGLRPRRALRRGSPRRDGARAHRALAGAPARAPARPAGRDDGQSPPGGVAQEVADRGVRRIGSRPGRAPPATLDRRARARPARGPCRPSRRARPPAVARRRVRPRDPGGAEDALTHHSPHSRRNLGWLRSSASA